MNGHVAVGVDGSPASLAAVEAAAREAALRGAGLRIVHAFVWPGMHAPRGSPLGPPEGALRDGAEELIARAVGRARRTAPGVEVTPAVVGGETESVLEAEAREARLLVVGGPGAGGAPPALLGSTAERLAAHAECPVMAVRGGLRPAGPVLLAVDGTTAGRAAAGFAFAESALRGRRLVALHVRDDPPPSPVGGGADTDAAEAAVRDLLSGHRGDHPEVSLDVRVVRGDPRQVLMEASAAAGLLVAGSRGHGGLAGLLLGSVSRALLRHAQCPVTVVRTEGKGS